MVNCEENGPVTTGFPFTKSQYAKLWCFLCWLPQQADEQTAKLMVVWDNKTQYNYNV